MSALLHLLHGIATRENLVSSWNFQCVRLYFPTREKSILHPSLCQINASFTFSLG